MDNKIIESVYAIEDIIYSLQNNILDLRFFLKEHSLVMSDLTDDPIIVQLANEDYDVISSLSEVLNVIKKRLIGMDISVSLDDECECTEYELTGDEEE